jgi:hypothetical protein
MLCLPSPRAHTPTRARRRAHRSRRDRFRFLCSHCQQRHRVTSAHPLPLLSSGAGATAMAAEEEPDTALLLAAIDGDPAALALALRRGADVNCREPLSHSEVRGRPTPQRAPAHVLPARASRAAVRASASATRCRGRNPLHARVPRFLSLARGLPHACDVRVPRPAGAASQPVALLTSFGRPRQDGWTPLHYAVSRGRSVACVQLLLQANNAQTDARSLVVRFPRLRHACGDCADGAHATSCDRAAPRPCAARRAAPRFGGKRSACAVTRLSGWHPIRHLARGVVAGTARGNDQAGGCAHQPWHAQPSCCVTQRDALSRAGTATPPSVAATHRALTEEGLNPRRAMLLCATASRRTRKRLWPRRRSWEKPSAWRS